MGVMMNKRIIMLMLTLSLTGLVKAGACSRLNVVQRALQQAARQRAIQEAALRQKACAKIWMRPSVQRPIQRPINNYQGKTVQELVNPNTHKCLTPQELYQLRTEREELEQLEYPSCDRCITQAWDQEAARQTANAIEKEKAYTMYTNSRDAGNALYEREKGTRAYTEDFINNNQDRRQDILYEELQARLEELDQAEQIKKEEQKRQERMDQEDLFEQEKQEARRQDYLKRMSRQNQPSYWEQFKEALKRIMYGNGGTIE